MKPSGVAGRLADSCLCRTPWRVSFRVLSLPLLCRPFCVNEAGNLPVDPCHYGKRKRTNGIFNNSNSRREKKPSNQDPLIYNVLVTMKSTLRA